MKKVREFYKHHLNKYGSEDIRAMGWYNEEEYSIRFEIASKIGDLNNSSILDVGCGFGGMYRFLVISEIRKFRYLGIDILPEMVEIAKHKNPTGDFKVADLLANSLGEFDYVICIGSLNIQTENHNMYFRKILEKMIDTAKKASVINFLTEKSVLDKGPYHVEDPLRLKKEVEEKFPVKIDIVIDPRVRGESFLFINKLE